MLAYLVVALGLYGVWWLMTAGGRYPLFYSPKWHDEQERLHKEADKSRRKQEEKDREDLARRIANEMKKHKEQII